MRAATKPCNIVREDGSYKWPLLEEAYRILIGKELSQAHRALSDIRMTIEVLQVLIDSGCYTFPTAEPNSDNTK